MAGSNIGSTRNIAGKRYTKIDHNLTKGDADHLVREMKAKHPTASIRKIKVDGRYFVYRG